MLNVDVGHFHFRRHGHHHLIVDHAERAFDFVHGIGQQLGRAFVKAAAIAQGDTAHNGAAPHVHVVDVHVALGRTVVVDAENVYVEYCLAHYDTARTVVLQKPVFDFQLLCLLEAQFAGEAVHLPHQILGEFGCVAPQNLLDIADITAVCVGIDGSGAASETSLYVVLQTQVSAAAGYIVLGEWAGGMCAPGKAHG